MKKGIKHNTKFNFWVVYENYHEKNKPDKRKFFSNEKEAKEELKNYEKKRKIRTI